MLGDLLVALLALVFGQGWLVVRPIELFPLEMLFVAALRACNVIAAHVAAEPGDIDRAQAFYCWCADQHDLSSLKRASAGFGQFNRVAFTVEVFWVGVYLIQVQESHWHAA